MSERYIENNKRLLPAELISKDDVEREVSEWREKSSGEYFEGEEELLFDYVYNLVIPNTDVDGRVNKHAWLKKGTELNEYYEKLYKKVPKDRRGIFIRRAKAIFDPLMDSAIRGRMREAAKLARGKLEEQSVGNVQKRLPGQDPHTFLRDGSHRKGLGYVQSNRGD